MRISGKKIKVQPHTIADIYDAVGCVANHRGIMAWLAAQDPKIHGQLKVAQEKLRDLLLAGEEE